MLCIHISYIPSNIMISSVVNKIRNITIYIENKKVVYLVNGM